MQGNLDEVINPLIAHEQEELLATLKNEKI